MLDKPFTRWDTYISIPLTYLEREHVLLFYLLIFFSAYFFFTLYFFLLRCICVIFIYVCVGALGGWVSRLLWDTRCRGWEPYSHPLEQQYTLSTAETFLQLLNMIDYFWDRISRNRGWPQAQYVADDGLRFLILLPLWLSVRITGVFHWARLAFHFVFTWLCAT